MKLASQPSDDFAIAASSPPLKAASSTTGDWLELMLAVMIGLAALMAFSLLLPVGLAQMAQEFMGWALAGSVLTVAVLAVVKGLETLLDC